MLKRFLRDYQDEAVNSALIGFEQAIEDEGGPYQKQMIVLPTGGGKTICFAAMADWWDNQKKERTLILVDQTDLVDQARDEILESTTLFPQIEQAERHASPAARVIIGTVQSLAHRLDKFPPDHFGLVVADECDRSIAPIWQKVLKHFDGNAKVLGVTATPDRGDQRSVLDYYERIAHEVDLFDLIKAGYLARIMVQNVPITIDISNVKQNAGDYDSAELDAALTPFFGEVCEAILKFAPERKTLVFLPLIATSQKFVEVARDHGIKADHIDGTSKDREQIKAEFKSGEIRLLANAMLLGRGYNDRSIDCIVNLRPTRSGPLYRQFVGRGTRTYCPRGCHEMCQHPEAKKDLLLLDFLWTHNKLGLQRPANLVARDQAHADKLTDYAARSNGTLELEGIDSLVAREAELALLKALQRSAMRRPGFFDAMEVAVALHQRDLIEYEPRAHWEAKPPSEKQLAALESMGFNPETIKSRGLASKLFTLVQSRREQNLSTLKQLRQLRKLKIKDADKVSFDGARAVLDNAFNGVPIPAGIDLYAAKKNLPAPAPDADSPAIDSGRSPDEGMLGAREGASSEGCDGGSKEPDSQDSRGGQFISAEMAAKRRIRQETPDEPPAAPKPPPRDGERQLPELSGPIGPAHQRFRDLFDKLQADKRNKR